MVHTYTFPVSKLNSLKSKTVSKSPSKAQPEASPPSPAVVLALASVELDRALLNPSAAEVPLTMPMAEPAGLTCRSLAHCRVKKRMVVLEVGRGVVGSSGIDHDGKII